MKKIESIEKGFEMAESANKEANGFKSNICYCLDRDCPKPQNDRNAKICVSCGSNLLLQNRYRAVQLIGRGGMGRTFKGIDESQPSQPYCAIKQFWVEPNSRSREKHRSYSKKKPNAWKYWANIGRFLLY